MLNVTDGGLASIPRVAVFVCIGFPTTSVPLTAKLIRLWLPAVTVDSGTEKWQVSAAGLPVHFGVPVPSRRHPSIHVSVRARAPLAPSAVAACTSMFAPAEGN